VSSQVQLETALKHKQGLGERSADGDGGITEDDVTSPPLPDSTQVVMDE
jgi:hypothetical protein